jgi:serine/threonine protein kinase
MAEVAPQSVAAAGDGFKPSVFGKFFLLQRLALGGMAEIFRAKVIGTGGFEKEMVVKRILPARAQDEGFIKMLINEAKLTVQLTHNNIAQIYECGSIDGQFFIAMEYVNGVSLKEMMASFHQARQQLSPEQAMFIVLQLLQGLDYAHRKTDAQGNPLKIVHCDVSPDNMLVSYQGEVKLLDFGIARAATGLSNYKEGMLMGKLGYVAPEQASLEQTFDHRVDIFAGGIILYELLTRQKPFPKATDVESLIQARKSRVTPPSEIVETLPKEVDAILTKALAYDPAKRYLDARAFADALVDVLFPTPHTAIQDLLTRQVQAVYAERVAKQRAARAHDALVMKVLTNVAEKSNYQRFTESKSQLVVPGQQPGASSQGDLQPLAGDVMANVDARLDAAIGNGRPSSGASQVVARPSTSPGVKRPGSSNDIRHRGSEIRIGIPTTRAVGLGVVVGLVVAGGVIFGSPYLRSGVVVVNSNPPGASVRFDGQTIPQLTPAVIENVAVSRPHVVEVSLQGYRTWSSTTEADVRKSVRTLSPQLLSSTGPLTIDSDPPGATVRLDEKAAGTTPCTIPNVTLDERHRLDLQKPGYEIDQLVFVPEKDGAKITRRLLLAPKKKVPQKSETAQRPPEEP